MTGQEVRSSSALCELTVSEAILAQDVLLHLVVKLASSLQLTHKTVKGKQPVLKLVVNQDESSALTQRNAVLRALCGMALHDSLDQAPYFLLGSHGSAVSSGKSSSPVAAASFGSLTSWMSIADSLQKSSGPDEAFLRGLEEHLTTNAFLIPATSQCSLADLDLALALLKSKSSADEVGVRWEDAYSPAVLRWLRQSYAVLVQYSGSVGGGIALPAGPALPAVQSKPPLFFTGEEDVHEVLASMKKQQQQPKARQNQQQQPPADGKNKADIQKEQQNQTAGKKQQQKGGNQQKQKGKQQQQQQQAAAAESYDITALDIRVGKITKVWHHETAEKLFCEEIDLGTEQRQVASGLRAFYEDEDLLNRTVLVLCNLKSRKLVGFPSHGMVLCASNADRSKVELVAPPEGSALGERVAFEGYDADAEPVPENKIAKKKVFEQLAPDLKTDDSGRVVWKGGVAKTSAGVVKAVNGMPNGSVS